MSIYGNGMVNHDAADKGPPIKIGAYAVNPSSLPSDVAAGDRTNIIADQKGRLINNLGTALDSTNDSVGAVARASATIGGSDTYFNNALTNTVIAVKASAGNIYGYRSYNSGASYAFIQVFDVASGSVTLGTTTPKDVYQIPNAGMYDYAFNPPVTHGTAVSIAATSTATGNGAPAATQSFTMYYK